MLTLPQMTLALLLTALAGNSYAADEESYDSSNDSGSFFDDGSYSTSDDEGSYSASDEDNGQGEEQGGVQDIDAALDELTSQILDMTEEDKADVAYLQALQGSITMARESLGNALTEEQNGRFDQLIAEVIQRQNDAEQGL